MILNESNDRHVLIAALTRFYRDCIRDRRACSAEQLHRVLILARSSTQENLEPAFPEAEFGARVLHLIDVTIAPGDVNRQPFDRLACEIECRSGNALPLARVLGGIGLITERL